MGQEIRNLLMPLLPVLIDTRKIVKAMSEEVEKRTAFVKAVNFNHLMPTRYSVDFELKKEVDDNALYRKQSNLKRRSRPSSRTSIEHKLPRQKKAAGVQYFSWLRSNVHVGNLLLVVSFGVT